ncbi:hypothetical protein [Streptomyces sp. NPDC047014]|uniref:hypothetical protein n=1 Tax=Streptomyces sp. NPDC047014 TaxID=3155736 RepID=UPI0033FF082D
MEPHTPRPISGIMDALVTTTRDPDGALALHLLVGPADRPQECDHLEVTLDPEHARTLLATPASHIPCRVGVSFNTPTLHLR